jgi:hypothetical protein
MAATVTWELEQLAFVADHLSNPDLIRVASGNRVRIACAG